MREDSPTFEEKRKEKGNKGVHEEEEELELDSVQRYLATLRHP